MPVHELAIADYGVDTYGLTVVTNTNLIKTNPKLVSGFLAATTRAMQASVKDPAAAVAALTKAVDGLDATREAKVLARTEPYWTSKEAEQNGLGWQTEKRWQGTVDVAKKLGLIETAIKPGDIFVNDFLGHAAPGK